jgi:predicted permease
MRSLWQDIRYGLKLLVKNPGFTAAAVFSLALGIGLNATMFCLVDRLILRPLPVDRPEQLVLIRINTEKGGRSTSLPYPEYLELRNQCKTLSGIVGSVRHGALLNNGEAIELLPAEVVTRNYFSVLGVRAHMGRIFQDGDENPTEPVAIISYRVWQSRFGGDPTIVGKSVELSRKPVTIIGIAPRGFGGTNRPAAVTDVWYPAEAWGSPLSGPNTEDFNLLGRGTAGVPLARIQAELDTIVRGLTPSNPTESKILGASVALEVREYLDRFGILGAMCLTLTGLILLIACVNVSNLLLARSQSRRKEIAVRLALGGSRFRLTRQLLTESLVLSLASALVGLLLTKGAAQALPALLPPMPMRVLPEFSPDARVVTFTMGLAFVTTLIFALIPALHASRLNLVPLLNESPSTRQGRRRHLSRSGLVVGQLCISLVLLTQSALLVKGFTRSLQADMGFEKKDMLVAQVVLGMYGYDESRAHAFFQSLQERLRALPGVKSVSLARRVPLSLSGGGRAQPVILPGKQNPSDIKCNIVDAGYFRTMGTALLRGRDFTAQDISSDARVIIINQTFARSFWPNTDPIGQVIRIGLAPRISAFTIIGIARDGPINRIGEIPEPYFYQPFTHGFGGELSVLVETAGDPGALAGPVRQSIHALDKIVSPFLINTLKEVIRQGLYDQEMLASFMGSFGLLGLILASFGLYGIVSYSVGQRTREIGLRMALGAQRRDALLLVLRQGLILALLGTAIGLPIALATGFLLGYELNGVSPADPTALGGTALLLVTVSLIASYIPARRATRVDPMIALRVQ